MNFTTLEKARVDLVGRQPFFASILMKHPMIEDACTSTICVNCHGQIKYNPVFVESLDRGELAFVLAHEAMHVALAHVHRCGSRDPELWNIATDAVINDMLKKAGMTNPPDGGIYIEGASEKSAEELYAELAKQAQRNKDKYQSKDGEAFPKGDLDRSKGEGTGKQYSDSEVRKAIQEGKGELASAAMAQRIAGRGSTGLMKLIEDLIASKVPWYQLLENKMTSKAERRTQWSRPNKRYEDDYMPRRAKYPTMGHVVIGLDCSGSVSDTEIKTFFGHINAIIEQTNPVAIDILYTTDRVEKVSSFTRDDYPLQVDMDRPSGGTDMTKILDWIEENDVDMEDGLCLIFTDGWTDTRKTEFETIWAVTTDKDMDEALEVLRVKDDGSCV